MPKLIRWNDVRREELNPLLDRQMIHGDKLTLARVFLRKGCVVPEHSHPNEQLSWMMEGALKFTFPDGEQVVVHAGEVLCIPANLPHKAEALEDTVDIDIFTPVRSDWATGNDAYLRKT